MSDLIKEYGVEHYEKTVLWLNNPELQKLFGITYSVTIQGHAEWIEKNKNNIETLALYVGKEYVGNIVLTYNTRHRACYLQIYIGEEKFRGQGKGASFMKLAIEKIFNQRSVHRLWLHVSATNIVARKLYINLGFQEEGIERDSVFSNGNFLSQTRMSLLSTDCREE